MRSLRTADQQTIDFLTDARAKVHTMALIHSQLYQSERVDQIDMGNHAWELVNYLSQVYATKSRLITPVIEPSDVYLSITQAIPCALILNEVISNAFKHAFQEGQKGTIEISIRREANDTIFLRVKDDGIGLPEAIDVDTTGSLGLKLIRNLVQEQLKGRLQIKRDKGTEVAVEFPILKEEVEHA
jgi:two-component sensor histidine kinase